MVLAVVCCLWFWCCSDALGESDGNSPGQKQIEWLIGMQDLHDTGLVESYEDINDANAWTFDQALAIIAFTEAGKIDEANMVLEAMQQLQAKDAKNVWVECYNAPDAGYGGCYKRVTGPIAWMVIAINYYEYRTGDCNYAPMARVALGWLETMMYKDEPNDGRYGSLRWSASEPNIISTEHNYDAYSAYCWRGILDSNDSYIEDANLIRDYLCSEMWGPTPGSNCCEDANVFCRGYDDPDVLATDCQSWGVLSLGPVGPDGEEFKKSLDWLLTDENSTRTQQDYNDRIQDVNGFKSDTSEWFDYVWVDGTEHVAAAFYSIGDDVNGAYFHNEQMGRIVGPNGGLVHSFREDEPNNITWERKNYRYNYVASVAWHYFNEVKINPFHPVGYPGCWNCATQCHGDADCDGDVDTGDWPAFRDGFAKSFPCEGYIANSCGDYDHDGDIDTEDWPEFRDNFGTSPPADCNVAGTWPPL